ncbi:MAG TPA: hypothetical protein VGE52_15685, partial [Pirellulales bacterium]
PFSGRGGFERQTGWVMPPIEPASASPSPAPQRPNAAVGKYLVIAVVALSIGAAVWIIIDALPNAFEVDPGRAARRGPPSASPAETTATPSH